MDKGRGKKGEGDDGRGAMWTTRELAWLGGRKPNLECLQGVHIYNHTCTCVSYMMIAD